ncbi:universal stress protein [Amycolatopsis jiangsuensis]|uniref:Nucleotide-binding universal stress UspA family protein n=1 Tax=Amycolatopsis jiangsuensis TaxID=1181879 RepID=A0A840IRY9_9PSEU|nr:universal stress protein [Amycolatopsis jiangsuensis]MBB4684309.1 nucleotide-binding universal stress UspA family protein [Amycolatopsis jiangsuensis]
MEQLVEEYGPRWEPGPYERGTDGPLVVLAGVDTSPTGMRAAAYAAGLARRQRARLVVVYVVSPTVWSGLAAAAAVDVQQETFAEEIRQLREELACRAEELSVPVRFVVRRGETFPELRQAALDENADLVVVGASEQGGHRLVGSIGNRLVRTATWPVVVVP